jgi:ComF family protein
MESIIKALIFLWDKTLNILFPNQCVICGKIDKELICNECYKNLNINEKIDKYTNKNFDEHLYIFKYEGIIRKLILNYKFNDKPYLNEFFVKIILKNKKICGKIKKYDIIIPVPIHKKRKNERGYNQSEIIAYKIAKNFTNINLVTNSLLKEKHTVAQSTLTREQRMKNVKQVYNLINKEKIENKRIILFDDIFTTGSTADECSKILKQNGAKEILVFTIAKDII